MAAQRALETKCEFLAFLDWDVLCPPRWLDTLVTHLKSNLEVDVVSGVYCTKTVPAHPLIYKGNYRHGEFLDWTPGDLLRKGIVGCGMGCAVIRCSVFKRIKHTKSKPWFKTIKEIDKKENAAKHWTEDLYFLDRLCKEVGPNRIMIDTGILCAHIDNENGVQYVLPEGSLPGKRLKEMLKR